MTVEAIERDFKERVCDAVSLRPEGLHRYRVLTPFMFEDGDHLAIILRQEDGHWALSDEGHTYMHLTYDLDERAFQQGTRQKIISNALSAFDVEDREGELRLTVPEGRYGDALYSFVQALLKISDITYLSRERVRSAFMEDFAEFLKEHIPESRRTFDWSDPERDPEGKYVVDCRANGIARPLFIYALPNDDKVRDATIGLFRFESWGLTFRSLGIYEDQAEINRNVVARFSDICDKQFSSLSANRDRIASFLGESLQL
jgi:hypothetical protein